MCAACVRARGRACVCGCVYVCVCACVVVVVVCLFVCFIVFSVHCVYNKITSLPLRRPFVSGADVCLGAKSFFYCIKRLLKIAFHVQFSLLISESVARSGLYSPSTHCYLKLFVRVKFNPAKTKKYYPISRISGSARSMSRN